MTPRALLCSVLLLASCGARSDLTPGEGGAPGPSPDGPSTTGPTTTSGMGGAESCAAFALEGEPFAIPFGQNATAPDVGQAASGDTFVAWLAQDGSLVGDATLGAEGPWPDPFDQITLLAPSAAAFVAGPGPRGPVAFSTDQDDQGWLLSLFGAAATPAFSTTGAPLFVAESTERALFASHEWGVLTVGSLQPEAGLALEGPQICLGSTLLGSVIPKGDGFVAAYADSIAPGQSCFAQVPQPGLSLVTMRYGPGAPMPLTLVEQLRQPEPLLHLALVATGFGAWLVYQTDGSTSRSMPPIMAYLVDHSGALQPEGAGPFALTPSGIASPVLAASAMDDAVVIAWVDAVDPSAPTIHVQRVEPDGAPGPAISFGTQAAFLSGRLRMTTTADQRALILAWTADVDKSVGVARISCVDP